MFKPHILNILKLHSKETLEKLFDDFILTFNNEKIYVFYCLKNTSMTQRSQFLFSYTMEISNKFMSPPYKFGSDTKKFAKPDSRQADSRDKTKVLLILLPRTLARYPHEIRNLLETSRSYCYYNWDVTTPIWRVMASVLTRCFALRNKLHQLRVLLHIII